MNGGLNVKQKYWWLVKIQKYFSSVSTGKNPLSMPRKLYNQLMNKCYAKILEVSLKRKNAYHCIKLFTLPSSYVHIVYVFNIC